MAFLGSSVLCSLGLVLAFSRICLVEYSAASNGAGLPVLVTPAPPPLPPHPDLANGQPSGTAGGSDTTRSNKSECKVAYTVGYGYRRSYHWADSLTHKQANGSNSATTTATLRFRVRAFSDAHIMLAGTSNPVEREPVYEIVLGAGKNTFSDIRRTRRTNTQVTMPTPEIVSPYELRGFWVRLSSDGIIEVGKENDDTAFMGWRDPQPLPIRYFAFCTWTGIVGKWEYDCPSEEQDTAGESAEVEETMTWSQRLRRDLLARYDPFVRPMPAKGSMTNVYLHLACQHISIEEHKSTITVHGTMSMHWQDDKLKWDPDSYGGLKTLHAASHEVWLPELLLYNAADGAGDALFNTVASQVMVSNDGAVMWSPQTRLQALCGLRFTDWPRDRHVCTLRLGVWSHAAAVQLQLMENGTALDSYHMSARWELERVNARHVSVAHPWMLRSELDEEEEGDEEAESTPGSVFQLEMTLRRRSSLYDLMLLLPVLAIAVYMLASFWISPLSWSRFMLCAINLLIITGFLAVLVATLPVTADDCPKILVLYVGGLHAAMVSTLLAILSISLSRYSISRSPPQFIMQQLDGILGMILLMPSQTAEGNSKSYGQLEDAKPVQPGRSSAATCAHPTTPSSTQVHWCRLATAIDRFACLGFLIFFLSTAVPLSHTSA